ncbi:MAG: molybdopterin-dependent oxidoreductase [Acidimicrobiia bacterium]|nr:molybdopterin-dependent oxidoreductase [Acidimicrobiia bacterium]
MTSPVGQSVSVIDAASRVTGKIDYVLDLELPGMAFGRIHRSPHPHARIVSIDTSRAESLRGVYTVLTAEKLVPSSQKYGRFFLDQQILADDRVRYIGEPVAAVAAASEEIAAGAVELIDVEYEILPAVFTIEEALTAEAPLLHDPRPTLRDDVTDMIASPTAASNLCSYFRVRHGSVDQGFEQSDFVFTDTFSTPAVQHVPLEVHVAVADYDDRLTIWSSTQMPHAIRAQMAELTGLPLSRVRVLTTNLGGGFGAKGSLRLEPIASMLSRASQRPVKIALERDEDFVTVTKHASTVTIKSGVASNGQLLAREVSAFYNTGAYADVGPMVARNAGTAIVGPYRIPHVNVDSYSVWTNLVPAGAFRGFGAAQGGWAYERHTDMIAERIGMDPVEFRRMNLLKDGDVYVTGETVADMHFDELLDEVVESLPSPESSAGQELDEIIRRGRAFATTMKATITPSTSTAGLILNEDGSLNVLTSSVDLGQGVKTVLAQIAAESLEIPYESVRVSQPDTDLTPYDQQTNSSRSTFSMGNAVMRAAEDVKAQLLEMAADLLEASVDDLQIHQGGVAVRGAPTERAGYGELLRARQLGNVQGAGSFVTEGGVDPNTGQGVASVHWHHGAVACEVEVDVETGKTDVVGISAAVFAGKVINPRLAELQVEGSVLFGLGQALFEEVVYEHGQVLNANLSDYMIPSFEDMPGRFQVSLLEEEGHGEIHGIGETALPPVSPAIANAIYDAVGVQIGDLPLTAESVLRQLESLPPASETVVPSLSGEPMEVG